MNKCRKRLAQRQTLEEELMSTNHLDGAMFEIFKVKAQALEDRGASPEEWRALHDEVRAYRAESVGSHLWSHGADPALPPRRRGGRKKR